MNEHALHEAFPVAHAAEGLGWAGLVLWLPALATVLCGVCCALRIRNKLPAWITVGLLAGSFVVTAMLLARYEQPALIRLFDWFGIDTGERPFLAHFSLYIDRLSLLWLLFVTGLGTLIALYASEYMEADVGRGYGRFFAGISVFLFAMIALVGADNLLMLYLGWEGVGFASYWLIGYYYERPSAVAAAKKAFIVNRIGDLGLALGLYLIWHAFGTIELAEVFALVQEGGYREEAGGWSVRAIPFLLMIGAFGKSAQIPLYVWLPDAMEGPTPVSALIHAATMVTAGVYLLCRMFPLMELHEMAAPTVAWIGGLTALLSATIGMAQYDIKRIFAYSTVSQLGYMFMGIGLLTTVGAAYHVFTHAFFKAVLFLTAGAVMHGMAGQIDLRKVSGLSRLPGWGITSWTMLYGCMCLAGVPFVTNGFFSKDALMAQAFISEGPGYRALGIVAIVTAFLTAYYCFRVWFRVCLGPVHHEPGDEHHGGAFHPHAPRIAVNLVLVVITAGGIWSIFLKDWAHGMVAGSSASPGIPHDHHVEGGLWADPHKWMPLVAGSVGIAGIAIAWYFHLANRAAADRLRSALLSNPVTRWLPVAMERKWYVDELYHFFIRAPLWRFGWLLDLFDRVVVDFSIIDGIAKLPRALGRGFQPLANGILQSYAISMAGGVALVALLVFYLPQLLDFFTTWLNGGAT